MATLTGTAGRDRLTGTANDDTLSGLGDDDTLEGLGGIDRLDGGAGADMLIGGAGNDVHIVDNAGDVVVEVLSGGNADRVESSATHTLAGEVENLTLISGRDLDGTGNAKNNVIIGNGGANRLSGESGADQLEGLGGIDRLDGGAGADMLIGGAGNDVHVVDNAGDVVVEVFTGGSADRVESSVTHTLSGEVENLTLTGTADLDGTGNAKNNVIIGNGGSNRLAGGFGADTLDGGAGDDQLDGGGGIDRLDGGAGADTLIGGAGADMLIGGAGNDVHIVDNAGDVVVEVLSGGNADRVESSATHTLAGEVENLTLISGRDLDGTGNAKNNVIIGNGGANRLSGESGADRLEGLGGIDRLDGGAGADMLIGGAGNDVHVVDNAGDVVVEVFTGGSADRVESSVTHTLADEVENLTLTGTANLDGTGNAKNNVIIGNSGSNVLAGAGGADTLDGGAGDDQLDGGGGIDRLDGGAGADMLIGGAGNDVHIVDNAGDVVVEVLSGGGADRVESSVTHTLAGEVENLTLTGAADIAGAGNAAGNIITGNSGNNMLTGAGGADTLSGLAGDDTLAVADLAFASADGGVGFDTLRLDANGTADLTALLPAVQSIEAITLAGPGGTTLEVGVADVLALSEATDTLVVRGDGNDLVRFDAADRFTFTGVATFQGDAFNVFEAGGATVLVQQGVATQVILQLADLDGNDGFRIDGASQYDLSGASVSAAGDVDGDGFEDLVIGADGFNGALGVGAGYIIFGRASGFAPTLSLSSLDGAIGFRLDGFATGDRTGLSVSDAGDVNGDGFLDVIVGAPGSDANYADSGASFVVFGSASGPGSAFALSTLDGTNGFRIDGERESDQRYGNNAVSTAGDFNGDGLADLVIGAIGNDRPQQGMFDDVGAAYIVFGRTSGFGSVLELSALDGANGLKLIGANPGDNTGISVSSAADVNGDGFADVVIGAEFADPNGGRSGSSFVVFGGASGFPASLALSSLDGGNGFRIDGVAAYDFSGRSVSSAGDFNGDGIGDIIVGARLAGSGGVYAGAAYVVFGQASGFNSVLALSTLDGTNGFRLDGVDNYDLAGYSVSKAGDVNGDGFDDLIVGAPAADPNGYSSGSAYLVFGGTGGFGSSLSLGALGATAGLRLDAPVMGDGIRAVVSDAGDIDGDGFDDLILGAPLASGPGGYYSGASIVVFGRNFTGAVDQLGGDGDDTLAAANGAMAVDVLVGGRGDDALTGDGGGDVLIGGQGDDIVTVTSLDTRRINGGTGVDTIAFCGVGATIDLSQIADTRLQSIERIDLLDGGNTLRLSRLEVVKLSEASNELVVRGGPSDAVAFDASEGFFNIGTAVRDGVTFNVLVSGNATVLVEQGVSIPRAFTPPQAAPPMLSALDGANGFRIVGAAAVDRAGTSVSDAGDVNGDGFADLLVGAYLNDAGGTDAGAAYIVFGRAGGFASEIRLSSLAASDGFRLLGEAGVDNAGRSVPSAAGRSVSSAGDFNGDGIGDLLVGAPSYATGGNAAGAAYLIFGRTGGFGAEIRLSSLTATDGLRILGDAAFDRAGSSVALAGDMNGDGIDDLLIGASGVAGTGAAYVIFGQASGLASEIRLSSLAAGQGFRILGETALDFAGASVSSAGDVNGDGIDDLLIGAPGVAGGAGAGATYLIFGRMSGFGSEIRLSSLAAGDGLRIVGETAGDSSGYSVSSAGDIDGDGFGDLIVGSRHFFPGTYAGVAHVVFGRASGFASEIHLSSLAVTDGFRIVGEAVDDRAGFTVSSAGDVNGDGLDDLIVGAPYSSAGGAFSGAAYVVFGRASGFGSEIRLSSLGPSEGFRLIGEATLDFAGRSVSAGGDVNGDGFADLIVGAPTNGAGTSYVVFGGNFTAAVDELGGDADDMLIAGEGAAESDVLIGRGGDDTLTGDGGADVLYGGAGDDMAAVGGLDFRRVDGGTGFDTLRLRQSGMIDISQTHGLIREVERLDIDNGAANTLDVRLADVLTLAPRNTDVLGTTLDNVLVIDVGEGEGDGVNLATADGWTEQANVSFGGETFRVFTNNAVTLAIDNDANIVIA